MTLLPISAKAGRFWWTALFALLGLATVRLAAAPSEAPANADPAEVQCVAGNAESCADLGFNYYLGRGKPQDHAVAVELIEKACELGSKRACDVVNIAYAPADTDGAADSLNRGKESLKAGDSAKAMAAFEEACAGKIADACDLAGSMHDLDYDGIPRDYAKAVAFFEAGCNFRNFASCDALALHYLNGDGVKIDGYKAGILARTACTHDRKTCQAYNSNELACLEIYPSIRDACPGFSAALSTEPSLLLPPSACQLAACKLELEGGPLRLEEITGLSVATDANRSKIACAAVGYFADDDPMWRADAQPSFEKRVRKTEALRMQSWLMSGKLSVDSWYKALTFCSDGKAKTDRVTNLRRNLVIWKEQAECARTACGVTPEQQATNLGWACLRHIYGIPIVDRKSAAVDKIITAIARKMGSDKASVAALIVPRTSPYNLTMEIFRQCGGQYGLDIPKELSAHLRLRDTNAKNREEAAQKRERAKKDQFCIDQWNRYTDIAWNVDQQSNNSEAKLARWSYFLAVRDVCFEYQGNIKWPD